MSTPSGARTLNSRAAMFFAYTGITPAMIMRLTQIGSQMPDSDGNSFDTTKNDFFAAIRFYGPEWERLGKTWTVTRPVRAPQP